MANIVAIVSMHLDSNQKSKSNKDYQQSLEPGPISKIRLRSALRITFAIGVSYVGFIESSRHSRTVVTIRLFLKSIFDAFN